MKTFKTLTISDQILKKLTFLLFLLVMAQSFAQREPIRKIIIIDPGHGGIDCGALNDHGVLEKNVVFDIAKRILKLNKLVLDNSFDIYLSRYSDQYISLNARANLVLELKADLFISLHCNTSKDLARGMEVFVSNRVTNNSSKNILLSKKLAKEILVMSNQKIGIKSRSLQQASFKVLRETSQFCPGVLLEVGFLSDHIEGEYLSKKSSSNAIALAILMAINNYYN